MDCSPQGFSVHGILQARILEWVVIPFSRGLPYPGIKPGSPALQADSFRSEALGKPVVKKKKKLQARAWDSKMTETKITVWSWKHLLIVGRVDSLYSGEWLLLSVNIHNLKVPKQNLHNPSKPDLNQPLRYVSAEFCPLFGISASSQVKKHTKLVGYLRNIFYEIFFFSFFPITWISFLLTQQESSNCFTFCLSSLFKQTLVKWQSLSHVRLCDPMDYTVHGILQARVLEWVAFPVSRGSSKPRDRTQVSCNAGRFFTSWAIH